jgi:carbohydrate-binding DOMON domain-containing protein
VFNVTQVNTEYVVSSSDSGGLADELKSLVQAFRFVCVPVPLCVYTQKDTHTNTQTHTHTHTHTHTCIHVHVQR